jgi:hypothetical protein
MMLQIDVAAGAVAEVGRTLAMSLCVLAAFVVWLLPNFGLISSIPAGVAVGARAEMGKAGDAIETPMRTPDKCKFER